MCIDVISQTTILDTNKFKLKQNYKYKQAEYT